MKIHILSDLHIEFAPFQDVDTEADVTVLAGDIGTGMEAFDFARELARHRPVVYVLGNHEYYRGHLPELAHEMRAAAKGTDLHVLENHQVVIGDTRFLGTTLWTDWALHGPKEAESAMAAARWMMADYRLIHFSPEARDLIPEDTQRLHAASKAWLQARLAESHPGPTVVVTHHAPHGGSSDPRFEGDVLTPAFVSDMDALMGPAALWVHGHTHYNVDYVRGGTRVITNQRGYPRETGLGFRPELVVEV